MDEGKVVEIDKPFLLLVKSENDNIITNDGYFAKMV